MKDPTYDMERIKANPAWDLAFTLSELRNDNAPIGWGAFIPDAESLLRIYDIRRNEGHPYFEEGEHGE